MRRTLTATLASFVLSLAFVSAAHAQTDAPSAQTNAPTAQAEVNAGALAYKDGHFDEAEQHFRRALEIDPTHKNAQLFLARSLQQQYKPDVEMPENVAVGERAVAAYQEILNGDPRNDDAYKAILLLYGQMKRDDKVVETLTQRANDPSVTDDQRAQAFLILASRQLKCSYDITERRESRTRDSKTGLVRYHMPADAADFAKARQCADEGLSLVEQAVSLAPSSASAWSYKANLLREAAKLAEMEGDAERKADYERQYQEAFDAQKRTSAEEYRKERERQKAPAPSATPAPDPAAPPESKPNIITASSHVSDGSAISELRPDYPTEAKAERAQGHVVVRVLIDEKGDVVKAEAVSGPDSLRSAAVAAALKAKFAPTLLSGRAVKVEGTITYNFTR